MILTVTLNPSVDHALFVDSVKLGDTNRVRRTERDAGGKGVNVARVAAELGADVIASGFLGGGPGAYVREVLDRQGVKNDFVLVHGETRVNFSVEDDSDSPPTTFNEPGPQVSEADFSDLLAKVQVHARIASWVTLGGSLPPGLPPDTFRRLIRTLADCRCRVVLDADGEPMKLGLEARPHFIKPNSKEVERLLGSSILNDEEAISAAKALRDRLDTESFVVVSRGEDGAVLASKHGVWLGASPRVEAKSTIGSGDSLIGGMLFAIEQGQPLEEAFRWGLAAGAATASTDGSEVARKPVVHRLLPQARITRCD